MARGLDSELTVRVLLLATLVGSIWAVFIVSNAIPSQHLNQHGIVRHSLCGLRGILFTPWPHANLRHVMAGQHKRPFLILGWMCVWPRIANFWWVTFGAMLGGGPCAWLLGDPYSIPVCASGLVLGYGGFPVARGYYAGHC